MKILRLNNEPVFPLTIKRKPSARRPWVAVDDHTFKVFWKGGSGIYQTTECPTEKGTSLTINAVQIKLIAEVWGSTGLCRIFFEFNGKGYEASQLTGWKPLWAVAWVQQQQPPSDAALAKMIQVASKMEVK